nr:MAG TPA: Integrin alpha-IIb, Integrin beta-3, transmembrane signaling, protein structure [Caudoviricetes sp.]
MKDFIEHLIESTFIIIILISALAGIILPIMLVLWLIKVITM